MSSAAKDADNIPTDNIGSVPADKLKKIFTKENGLVGTDGNLNDDGKNVKSLLKKGRYANIAVGFDIALGAAFVVILILFLVNRNKK